MATQISKSINDCVQIANNEIVFNLKEQDDKRKDKELVIYVPLSLEKKLHSKGTSLGSMKSTSIRPAKLNLQIEFTNSRIESTNRLPLS